MQNRGAFAAVVAGHAGLAALLSLCAVSLPRVSAAPMMALVEVAAPLSQPATAPPMTEDDIVVDVEVPSYDVVETAAAPSVAAAGPADCDLTENVASGLRASAAVHAALDSIPHRSRSVANAVMIWNGAWADAGALGGPAQLAAIRDAVVASIRAAPAECREAAVAGPRLLFVASSGSTAILALGSGSWSWDQLLETEAPGDAA